MALVASYYCVPRLHYLRCRIRDILLCNFLDGRYSYTDANGDCTFTNTNADDAFTNTDDTLTNADNSSSNADNTFTNADSAFANTNTETSSSAIPVQSRWLLELVSH
jgi:hypothetical protein